MNYIKLITIVILILFSCKAERDLKIIDDIHSLEFSRISKSDIFEKYAQISSPDIRLQVAKSIGRMQDSLYISTLIKLLDDLDQRVVEESIFALGQIASKESETVLSRLLGDEKYSNHRKRIIEALSKMEQKESNKILLNYLKIAPDSLKSIIVEQLAISESRSKMKNNLFATIKPFLSHNDDILRLEAAYYYSRNPNKLVAENLIRAKFSVNSLGNKYRLKSLAPVINYVYQQFADSEMLDSLKGGLQASIEDQELPWQIKLYQIPIYLYKGDSTKINVYKNLLLHKNPHIRLQTIFALGKLSSNFAENLLLEFYNKASWSDKGTVIETLAIKNSWLAHRLIQQNLDRGNTHFKEKLLRALAKIPDPSARKQLKQFLQVPNRRLQFTAFTELNKLGLLNSNDIKTVLQEGDIALTSLAADWIFEHLNSNYTQLLIQAYEHLNEPEDIETMVKILITLNKLNNKNTVPFLKKIVQETSQALLFDQALLSLKKMNIETQERERPTPKLYLPDTIIVNKDEIYATIFTERGDINLKLWAEEAPVTVSNFIHLAKKGFYKNLTFHRVVSDFVIQGGDPRGDGWGGPGYHIPCEYNKRSFLRGSVGMATSGKDTAGSQFFICHSEQPHLNGRYTLFGEVVEGMNVVDMIEIDDKIIDILINN